VNVGVLPAIHFLGQLAETARNVTSSLPGAKPLTTEQQQRQGYGPQVGQTGTSGATAADVQSAAKNAVNKNIEEYDARMTKLDEQITQLRRQRDAITGTTEDNINDRAKIQKQLDDISTIKSIMSDFLAKMRPATPPPQPPNGPQRPVIVPDSGPAGPSSTGALPSSEVLAANISRGIINIASADMLTLMKEPGKTSESVPVKTQSDSDVIASNTMLAGKMDELIGLMRTSGGYLQKISVKDYA
jgi:hypothetical protein